MMKILWMCNAITAEFADIFGVRHTNALGWMTGLLDAMRKIDEIEISVCFPIFGVDRLRKGVYHDTPYYSFHVGYGELPEAQIIQNACRVIEEVSPDIVHMWGTEYRHCLAVIKACNRLAIQNVLVDLQANIGEMARVLGIGLPDSVIVKRNDRQPSIAEEKIQWEKNAIREKEIIKSVRYITGRTTWDRLYSKQTNKSRVYYHCDRLFRPAFYNITRKWSFSTCQRYRIFVSQGFYPLKGLHYLLQAMPYVSKEYPDVKLIIGGPKEFVSHDTITPFGEHILELIYKYSLENIVEFIGLLDENGMIDEMLKANLFISPSLLENNANSVCEAMFLGTPVLSSFVGGIPSVLTHNDTGFTYPYDDVRILAAYVCELFSNPQELERVSRNAIEIAKKRHDIYKIKETMKDIYLDIEKRVL